MQTIKDSVVIEGVSDTDAALTIKAYEKGGAAALLRLQDESGAILGGWDNVGVPFGAVAGGGAPNPATMQKARFAGGNVAVSPSIMTNLNITSRQAGDDILDFTTPTAPAVKVSGVYGMQLNVLTSVSMTVGINFNLMFTLDNAGVGQPVINVFSPAATTALASPRVSVAISWYLAQGMTLRIQAYHEDSASRNLNVQQFTMQRLV